MTIVERAERFREKLQLQLRGLAAEKAVILPEAYDRWKAGSYAVGDMRQYGGQVWVCCQAHDSSENEGWYPRNVPALWTACHAKDAEYAKAYVPPTGAQDAYQAGEYIVWTDGAVYECLVDNTVHSPAELASAWKAVEV